MIVKLHNEKRSFRKTVIKLKTIIKKGSLKLELAQKENKIFRNKLNMEKDFKFKNQKLIKNNEYLLSEIAKLNKELEQKNKKIKVLNSNNEGLKLKNSLLLKDNDSLLNRKKNLKWI